ncbi:hypothetical protein ASE12_16500 [Aeromicrobium sp. Root236]|uniref:DUF1707 SHOCT-like domain-containing protein n=1 Tax=Aeromicrobium sp. Root236 TaxID=1736498 RepID=UPI0006F95E4E|nr:DUF1707 domain-containing protein [Aeromicrobium sp. Root236]KRC66215.1 hypothetical protein ASE12_16500 [Aeromicrobium sp. Root236]
MEGVPATDDDRRGAFDDLKELLSSGRIDAAEFATRSSKISSATTLSELAALVTDHGRAPATASAPKESFGTVVGDALTSPQVGRTVGRFATAIGMRRVILWALALAVTGGAALATQFFDNTGGDPSTGAGIPGLTQPTATAAPHPELLTRTGFARLRDDMRAKIGSTHYLSAVIYPDYATIEVPVSGDPDHSQRWYYNGSFPYNPTPSPRRPGSKSADLGDVRVTALAKAIRLAPAQLNVPDPDRTYVIFDSRSGRSVMSVYVTNPSNDTGYWTMRLDGRTVTKYKAP